MLTAVPVRTPSDNGSRGFVDDTGDLKAGKSPDIVRALALSIVEVRWNGDNRVRNQWTKVLSAVRVFAFMPNLHNRLSTSALALEWPRIHVTLDLIVGMITTNDTFRVKGYVVGVTEGDALDEVANETFLVGEGNP